MELSSISANELGRLCCHSGSDDVWREFVRRFQRPIALSVLRVARSWGIHSPATVDDLVQETFLRLCADDCRLLRAFVPREPDSIIGYLKVVAANVTRDKLRADNTQKRGGSMERHNPEGADLDTLFVSSTALAEMDRAVRRTEIDRALRSLVPHALTERDRTIFWLYFEQGFSAREIGSIASIGLTVKGVESSIHRTIQQVREAFQAPHARPPSSEGISASSAIYKEEP